MKKQRYLSVFLSFILILLMFSGCRETGKKIGGQGNEKNNKIEQEGDKNEVGDKEEDDNEDETVDNQGGVKLPLADKPTTLVIAAMENWYPEAPLSSGLPIWEEIEKKTNVAIEWETPADYAETMKTRLATGADLPDIMRVPGDPTKYGMDGLLIPLNGLIEEHGPNIKKAFDKYEHSKGLMTSGDGNIYGLGPIVKESAEVNTPMHFIRKDWLNKLGLNEPDTVDDWFEVLRAFKEQDPNENNEQDEIAWAGGPYFLLGGAFGLHLHWSNRGFWEKDGQVIYQWADPKMKDLLEVANNFYKEGLIVGWPDTENIINNLIGSMWRPPDLIPGLKKQLHEGGHTNAEYIPIKPPKGSDGARSLESYGIIDYGIHSITKDCKDPELAFKFMDYMWSEEGINYMAWGIEGESYVIEEGKPKYTDFVLDNPDGLGPPEALRTLGAWPTTPWVQQADTYLQIHSVLPELQRIPHEVMPHIVDPFPRFLDTPEEEKRLSELLGDIEEYKNEMINAFYTGEESLDQFDEYVRTLKDKGLDEVLEIKQKQYDRVFK